MSGVSCTRCPYHARDYCHRCGAPLCEEDMKAGCCGVAPAESGVDQDFDANHAAVCGAAYGDLGLPREDMVTC